MENYPKYRVRITLDEEFEDAHTPQIKEYYLTGWYNLSSITVDVTKPTKTVEDIHSVSISRSGLSNCAFTTELGAKMVIKFHHLELKTKEALAEKNKDKKKVRIIKINPEEL